MKDPQNPGGYFVHQLQKEVSPVFMGQQALQSVVQVENLKQRRS
ncbi:hypothetical protein [Comamonas sp. GB3 AK4-5]